MENHLTQITNYLLTQSWQIAVLAVVIAAISLALKNRSAHIRYLLWLIVLAKCLAPPLVTIPLAILPQESLVEPVPILPAELPAATIERVNTAITERPIPISTPVVKEKAVRLTVHQWLGFGWVVGVAVFAVFGVIKAWRTNLWLCRQRKPLPAKLQSGIEDLFSGFDLKTLPKIWLLEGISQPFVWGLLRGSIYLPADFVNVDNAEHRKGVLGHELSHILRFDAAVNCLQVIAQAIFWFHPFVWWANKRIRAEREKCCDEMAIARLGAKVRDYSIAIVNILVEEHESTRPVPSLAVAGPVKNIEERIKTMLRPGKKFYKRPSLVAVTVALLLALLIVPMALVLTARAETKPSAEQKPEPAKSLHQAAADGDLEQVKLLISKGADVNEKDKDGRTPLHSAAWSGRKDVAEVLIAKGANINETDVSGQTPLHLAASFGTRFVPELLLAKGANVNARDKKGNTPLHVAAGWWCVNKDLLELLIAKGADVKARNDAGQTPLHSAVMSTGRRKHDDVVEFLLANGADINAKDKSGCTPIHFAADNGQRKVVELLLAKGADIKAKAADGTTTLHRAVMSGRSDVVELLLDRGVDINSAQSDGRTALHHAANAGNNSIAEVLISKGADVNAKTVRGETPAHLAAVRNYKDAVKLLISKGAEVSTIQLAAYIGDLAKVESFIEKGVSVNTQDRYWPTPLHAAAATGQREVAEFLISKGASVNADAVAQGGETALHYAADGGSKEVVELLISKGAIIDARNKNGQTALHLAATTSYTDIVKLLIAGGANVNAEDKDGWTPLHYAAQNGHKDVVLLLIDNGADVNVEATDKSKPLDFAAWSGHKDVVKLLIDKGTNISKDDNLLYCACMYGHRDLAELLIKKGTDVNSKAWRNAPSLEAVWNAYTNTSKQPDIPKLLDILKLLLDNGADPNAKDRWDWSLLHYTEGNVDLARLLLDKGANPNIRTSTGQTPLHLEAEPGHKAMVELLISRGADVNAKDFYGRTPLSYAEDLGSNEVSGPRDAPRVFQFSGGFCR